MIALTHACAACVRITLDPDPSLRKTVPVKIVIGLFTSFGTGTSERFVKTEIDISGVMAESAQRRG